MNKLISKLTPTTEFLIVLMLGFGLFIYSSVRNFIIINGDYTQSWTYNFSNQGNYFIVIYELLSLSLIIYVLKVRGWKKTDFNLAFTFRSVWIALLLMFVTNFISNLGFVLIVNASPVESTLTHVQFELEASWVSIFLVIVINSIYEEFILLGYVFKRLEKYHPAIIAGLSVIVRESYHTYQGWLSLITIIPLGLVFGYYYYKYKKLWPVILAHGFINLITFLRMHFNWYETQG